MMVDERFAVYARVRRHEAVDMRNRMQYVEPHSRSGIDQMS